MRSLQHADSPELLPCQPGSCRPQYVHFQLCAELCLHSGKVRVAIFSFPAPACFFRTWYLGSFFCLVTNFMSYYTVATSVFSLMAITAERLVFSGFSLLITPAFRYLVVMKPLNGRVRQSSALLGVVFILLLAFVCCVPALVFSTTSTLRCEFCNDIKSAQFSLFRSGTTICFLLWPDGNPNESLSDQM